MQTVTVRPPAPTTQTAFLCVLYPVAAGQAPPAVSVGPEGVVKLAGDGRTDTIVFGRTPRGWTPGSVNGAPACAAPTGQERSLVPYRTDRP